MGESDLFAVMYSAEVKRHLGCIESKFHRLIRDEIEAQLSFEPHVETRNRKPLKRPAEFGAEWELRLGPKNCFRVFYQVFVASSEVHILAIGVKDRNQLLIGGEEFEL